nr:hypothetical protein [Herbaspirillum sp. ASV7]
MNFRAFPRCSAWRDAAKTGEGEGFCAFLAALMAWECEMLADLRSLVRKTDGQAGGVREEVGAPTVMRHLHRIDAGAATWQVVLAVLMTSVRHYNMLRGAFIAAGRF